MSNLPFVCFITEGEGAGARLPPCTRRPERAGCDRDCVYQLANAPEDCAVRAVLEEFYEGRSCVLCSRPMAPPRWDGHKPALMRAYDRRTFECRELPPEALSFALAPYLPVCWDCHTAESLRRPHPDLLTDRYSKTLARV